MQVFFHRPLLNIGINGFRELRAGYVLWIYLPFVSIRFGRKLPPGTMELPKIP